jgi:hypothetical protein
MWLSDAQWNRIERAAERATDPVGFRRAVATKLRNVVNPTDRAVTRAIEAVMMQDGVGTNTPERSECCSVEV